MGGREVIRKDIERSAIGLDEKNDFISSKSLWNFLDNMK
jgi:hypothetical protein